MSMDSGKGWLAIEKAIFRLLMLKLLILTPWTSDLLVKTEPIDSNQMYKVQAYLLIARKISLLDVCFPKLKQSQLTP